MTYMILASIRTLSISLSSGARSVGLPPTAHGLFPDGAIELVDYFYRSTTLQMSQQLHAEIMRDHELELEYVAIVGRGGNLSEGIIRHVVI